MASFYICIHVCFSFYSFIFALTAHPTEYNKVKRAVKNKCDPQAALHFSRQKSKSMQGEKGEKVNSVKKGMGKVKLYFLRFELYTYTRSMSGCHGSFCVNVLIC